MAATIKTHAHLFKSPYGDVQLPDEGNLVEFMLAKLDEYGEKPAIVHSNTGETIKYNELRSRINRVASGLASRGFKEGDVACFYSRNNIHALATMHGIMLLGGVMTPSNPLYTANEVKHQMKDSGATWLFTELEFLDKAREATGHIALKHNIIILGDAPQGTQTTSLNQLMDNDGKLFTRGNVTESTIAMIPYSSGTSGPPKGVLASHGQYINGIAQMGHPDMRVFFPDMYNVNFLPFYHISGCLMLHISLYYGSTNVIMPAFDLKEYLSNIQRYKVVTAMMVPPILLLMGKSPLVDEVDISSLKDICAGAAPISHELGQLVKERLGIDVRQAYGMTEVAVTHISPIGSKVWGAAGKLMPNTEMLIVDTDSGKELGIGGMGEVWVRGPGMMKGYLNRPDATANTIDSEGFLHTGDVGYVDEDGYLYIVDRVKELIKYNAFQVPPAELEALLLSNPSIADAAVIGVPEIGVGELPKGFVVKKPNVDLTETDVLAYVAERIAPQKKLRLVEFIDEIPKSASGKILRRFLRDREKKKRTSKL